MHLIQIFIKGEKFIQSNEEQPVNPASSPMTNPATKPKVSQASSLAPAPVSKSRTQTAAAWQELDKDKDGTMRIIEVRDFGDKRSRY